MSTVEVFLNEKRVTQESKAAAAVKSSKSWKSTSTCEQTQKQKLGSFTVRESQSINVTWTKCFTCIITISSLLPPWCMNDNLSLASHADLLCRTWEAEKIVNQKSWKFINASLLKWRRTFPLGKVKSFVCCGKKKQEWNASNVSMFTALATLACLLWVWISKSLKIKKYFFCFYNYYYLLPAVSELNVMNVTEIFFFLYFFVFDK